MSTFLHVHVPIFLHTGIEYIHEKFASLEKCKKVDMARFSTRELMLRFITETYKLTKFLHTVDQSNCPCNRYVMTLKMTLTLQIDMVWNVGAVPDNVHRRR